MSEIWVQIFKVGNHTDSAGKTSEWTADDVNKIATLYNERVATQINNEAPIVKGHPKTDDPAFGWAKELKLDGDILKARIEFTDSEFEQEVKDKKYKNISIALNNDLNLRHIGFLGAVPPAVKELEAPEFNEANTVWFFSDFSELPFLDTPNNPPAMAIPTPKVKPAIYANLTDEQFGDPVNYRFPIYDLASTLASKNNFHSWRYENEYTQEETIFIQTRILQALQKFGIDIKQDNFYFSENENPVSKPEKYSTYSDDEFGDLENYKFPIKTKEEVLAAIRNFMKDNVWSNYTQSQQQRISARILAQATKFNIQQSPELWSFNQMNNQNSNNKESQNINISKTFNNANNTEFNQMEQLQKMFADIIAWLNSNVSAEVGSQVQAQFESQLAEIASQLEATTTKATATATEMEQKFNATNKLVKELQDKLINTEIDNELNKYDLSEKEFSEVKNLLKLSYGTKEFSESGMKGTILSLLESKKKAEPNLGHQFSAGTSPASSQHEAITNIANSQKVSYAQATKLYFEGVK